MTTVLLNLAGSVYFALGLAVGDVTGAWDMTLKADGTTIPSLVCSLAQKGQDLTGSCKAAGDPDDRAVQLTSGRIDGEQIEFGWRVQTPDGENWIYTLRGIFDEKAGTMKGNFKVASRVGGADGSFSATKRTR